MTSLSWSNLCWEEAKISISAKQLTTLKSARYRRRKMYIIWWKVALRRRFFFQKKIVDMVVPRLWRCMREREYFWYLKHFKRVYVRDGWKLVCHCVAHHFRNKWTPKPVVNSILLDNSTARDLPDTRLCGSSKKTSRRSARGGHKSGRYLLTTSSFLTSCQKEQT